MDNEEEVINSKELSSELLEEGELDIDINDEGEYIEKGITPPTLRSPGNIEDPRQGKMWEIYIKGFRKGQPSAKQAALDAGYSLNTAINVTSFKWFKDKKKKLLRSKLLTNAERNIDRILDLDYSKIKILDDGSQVEGVDVDVLRVVADMSKTIVTTLGKDVGYSTKTEVGGKIESDIKINSISYADPIPVMSEVVEEQNKQIVENIINNENK